MGDTCPIPHIDQFAVLDLLPVGVCLLDNTYKVVYWNCCLVMWTNIQTADIVGRDIRDVFPRLGKEKYTTRIDAILQGGPPAIFSPQLHKHLFPSTLPTGGPRLQHTVINAVRGSDGTYFAMITAQDVTEAFNRLKAYSEMRDQALLELEERRKVEKALRESEAKVAGIANAVLDAVVMIDGNGIIKFWNPAATRLLGYSAQEALDKEFFNLLLPLNKRQELRGRLGSFGLTGCAPFVGKQIEIQVVNKNRVEFSAELLAATFQHNGSWHAVITLRDITKRKEAERSLRELARTDELTKVCNRRAFMEALRQELMRARRYGHNSSLLMLDADNFKAINDTYGHDVGDAVLRHLALSCRSVLRSIDVVGRLGGEEFAILLPNTNIDCAFHVAERLRSSVENNRVQCHEQGISYTVSLGVCSVDQHADNPELVLKSADTALYKAKRLGRNRVVVNNAG